ncbi:phospholipase D family protein [Roseateles sp. NT4]|uniref:phospholipase D family protein n=1 Tax=Roseateles sp. NT4 TaxID=3453715 RepID=UPI003EEA4D44
MEYLNGSSAIKKRLHALFSGDEEQWAIVAFVGYGALDQLPPRPKNLRVICWPKAGATHPDGVRRLIGAGVDVYFCDRLHSKIFWAEGRGHIVGSANLSRNALGCTGQHEFGVYLDDPAFDARKVLSRRSYTRVTEELLAKLDLEHVRERTQDLDLDQELGSSPTFSAFRASTMPRRWKLITWDEPRQNSDAVRDVVKKETGLVTWANSNDVGPGVYREGDFAIQIHLTPDGKSFRAASCKWMRIDLIRKIGRTTVAIQLKRLDQGPPPPFIIDSDFRKAFRLAFEETEWEEIYDGRAQVLDSFMKKIEAHYKIE